MQIKSLVILGPTASGKTQLSLKLSQYFSSEIINCDTSIFYKYFSIGTGKPNKKNLKLIKHNLLDFLEPDQDYSLAEFLNDANNIINKIVSDNKVPILVGGSGQYLKALIENWNVSNIKPNMELRKKLEKEIDESGLESLYQKLKNQFPENAQRVDSKNPRRVIRAFELGLEGGTVSRETKKNNKIFFKFGLTMPREILYKKIDERIEKMFEDNWVGEVEDLIKKGFNKELNSFSSIGYNEIYDHLVNKLDLDIAINLIKKRTRNLVRHQYNWFKLNDPEIKWFDSSKHSINYISEKILKEKIEHKF